MTPATILLLVVVDGFVAFYCYRAYQQGMPAGHAALWLVVSLVAVNVASVGRKLGLRKAPRR
ncbi:MAG TPA: hypothetical protein VHX36_06065 [Candidatus Acidoferrales bacterium]|nr:hypothetical protein [Candidatus Acidoferrales bacterium]